jgi:H+/gluconate symporter-like permease
MSILILVLSILLPLTFGKLNAFLSLIFSAILVGIAKQMPLADILASIQKGIGSTLGSLILILGLGVMLGSLLSESGAATN